MEGVLALQMSDDFREDGLFRSRAGRRWFGAAKMQNKLPGVPPKLPSGNLT